MGDLPRDGGVRTEQQLRQAVQEIQAQRGPGRSP
jgi:hypothetical protein